MKNQRLAGAFDRHFASYLLGKIKPDSEIFLEVVETLQCSAGEILFLDDNQLNVDGAKTVGMNAVRVTSVSATAQTLVDFGVISD
jgi:putative hydrolase of the HAD superfamily